MLEAEITLQYLQAFLNSIKGHRADAYCTLITNVYFNALKNNIIKNNISIFLEKSKNKTVKVTPLNLKEQKLVLKIFDKCKIKNEVLFLILTEARRAEAINCIKTKTIEKTLFLLMGLKQNRQNAIFQYLISCPSF